MNEFLLNHDKISKWQCYLCLAYLTTDTLEFFTYAQKCQYWHFRLYCMKTKKSSEKMLPQVGTEPRQPLILSPTLSFLH